MKELSSYPDVDDCADFIDAYGHCDETYDVICRGLEQVVIAGGDLWVERFDDTGAICEVLILIPTRTGALPFNDDMRPLLMDYDDEGMFLYVHTLCRHPLASWSIRWHQWMERARKIWPRVEYLYWERRSAGGELRTKKVAHG